MPRNVRIAWRLLLLGFGLQVLVGYTVALGIDGPLWAWHQDRVGLALWGSSTFPPDVGAYRGWAMGLGGATIASFAVAGLWIVAVPLRRGEPWAPVALLTSVLAWFPVDTVISAAHGVWINVWFNTSALLMICVPLAVVWRWAILEHGRSS